MKLRLFPADLYGCGMYRMIWPARAVAAAYPDIEIVVTPPGPVLDVKMRHRWDSVRRTREVIDVSHPDADVVLLQRPLQAWWAGVIDRWHEQGVRVIIDMDDDLASVHHQHAAYRIMHPRWSPESNWRHVAAACRRADVITVSTPALVARYGNGRRDCVIPNAVPDGYLAMKPAAPNEERVVIGWAGQVAAHPGDLDVTRGAVPSVCADTGARFRVVGGRAGIVKALGFQRDDEFDVVDFVHIDDYPAEVARFTVGVVPLTTSTFNLGKSGLKGLEMASVGVPFVASKTPSYLALAGEGAGLVASNRGDWYRLLKRLVCDEQFREDAARRGRAVAANNTIDVRVQAWAKAWGIT